MLDTVSGVSRVIGSIVDTPITADDVQNRKEIYITPMQTTCDRVEFPVDLQSLIVVPSY